MNINVVNFKDVLKKDLEATVDQFVAATENILNALRHSPQRECVVCGAEMGKKHAPHCVFWPLIYARKKLRDLEKEQEPDES